MDKKIALTHEVYNEKDHGNFVIGFNCIYHAVGEYTAAKEFKVCCVFQSQCGLKVLQYPWDIFKTTEIFIQRMFKRLILQH
jgi:hypothetical protein